MQKAAEIIPENIPAGYCQCGCGERTRVSAWTDRSKGFVKGEPRRFVVGHNARTNLREKSPAWRGGRSLSHGYVLIRAPLHPSANARGYVREHILVAEKALGKPLPTGAVVHHVNGRRDDNRPENLVILQDNAHHQITHRRQRAYDACGNPNWIRCSVCQEYAPPEAMHMKSHGPYGTHRECSNKHRRAAGR